MEVVQVRQTCVTLLLMEGQEIRKDGLGKLRLNCLKCHLWPEGAPSHITTRQPSHGHIDSNPVT